MKRGLTLIVVVIWILTSGLVVSCSPDEQGESQKSYEQMIFQKVDSLQAESFLRQQETMDKTAPHPQLGDPFALLEYEDHLKFLREQYQQLQEVKYDPALEELDGLLTANLAEQQRLITKIEAMELNISKAEEALARGESVIDGGVDAQANLPRWKVRIEVMSEQLEFLMEQYQELEELRDFLLE